MCAHVSLRAYRGPLQLAWPRDGLITDPAGFLQIDGGNRVLELSEPANVQQVWLWGDPKTTWPNNIDALRISITNNPDFQSERKSDRCQRLPLGMLPPANLQRWDCSSASTTSLNRYVLMANEQFINARVSEVQVMISGELLLS